MSMIFNRTYADEDAPPPAYHDGRAIGPLPAYREVTYGGTILTGVTGPLSSRGYCRDFDYPPTLERSDDTNVSSELPSYESAEALKVLERWGYKLDLEIGQRKASPSMLEYIRAPVSLPPYSFQAGPSEALSHSVLSSRMEGIKPGMLPSTSAPRRTKRKRDASEGEGDPE